MVILEYKYNFITVATHGHTPSKLLKLLKNIIKILVWFILLDMFKCSIIHRDHNQRTVFFQHQKKLVWQSS